jgi:flagellar hook-associated protein 1 FlgK
MGKSIGGLTLGTLFSTLDVARSGLQVAQAQIDIAGHNIANVNKVGFSRQRAQLVGRTPHVLPYGQLGRGVQVALVERIRDTFLDVAYRQQAPKLGQAEVFAQYYARLEDVFLEPGENGFSNRITQFFDALNDFADNVESFPTRQSVLSEAEALAGSFQEVASRLDLLRTDANEEVKNVVPEINSLADRIASLNVRIRQSELNGTASNDLRDDRDVLLDELSAIVNITYRERADGQVDVLIGSDVLVDGGVIREMEAVINPSLDPEHQDLVEVRFAATGTLAEITEGSLYAALNMRDVAVPALDDRIDTLAATFIRELNAIQSRGSGLDTYAAAMTSGNLTDDAVTPLGSAGLPFSIAAGSFDIVAYDNTGTATTYTVNVDPNTQSLSDLAAAITTATGGNITGTVTGGGRALTLTPGAGFTFSFANDTAGVLPALGLNGLFTGTDASNIAVNQTLLDNPNLLTSRYTTDLLNTGDNSAALEMAGLRNVSVLDSGSSTLSDYYETSIVQLGVDTRTNQQTLDVETAFVQDFERRRQEVSGVSLDEELTFMIQFQRAFEGAARVITVTDRMLESLLGMAL